MLQDLFHDQLVDTVYDRAVAVIEEKLKDKGVILRKRERKRIRESLQAGELDSFSVSGRWWDRRHVSIEITPEDLEALERDIDAFLDALPELVPRLVDEVTPGVVSWIERKGFRSLRASRRDLRAFEKRLARTWREPFELLDAVIHLAVQVGMDAGGAALESEDDDESLSSLLLRLHGRGVRVAQEVAALLRSGFPDAALARWRTLHEVTVVALFVAEHGEACAERYVAHQAVANYKGALSYQATAGRLGFVEYAEEELEELRTARDIAVAEYGSAFGGDYGWAKEFLGVAPANFAEIEKSVSIDHYRSVFKWASQEVHAGVKALFSDLVDTPGHVILIGPSNTGFTDPAQYTCLSLAMLSSVLLQVGSTMDSLVSCSAMLHFVERAKDSFHRVQEEVEKRDRQQ